MYYPRSPYGNNAFSHKSRCFFVVHVRNAAAILAQALRTQLHLAAGLLPSATVTAAPMGPAKANPTNPRDPSNLQIVTS